MNYAIPSKETLYKGTKFRSRLEARWAAFFDLCNFEWIYEPYDVNGWMPDFLLKFPCRHSECRGYHVILIEVKPYYSIDQFSGHPCTKYYFGSGFINENTGQYENDGLPVDSSACFGLSPNVTYWEMVHGAGGGSDDIVNWVEYLTDKDSNLLWNEAGNIVRREVSK